MVPPPSKPSAVHSLRAVAAGARDTIGAVKGTTYSSIAAVRDLLPPARSNLDADTASVSESIIHAEKNALSNILASINTEITKLTRLIDDEHEWAGALLERQATVSSSGSPQRRTPHKVVIVGDTVFAGTMHMAKPHDPRSIALKRALHEWRARTAGSPQRLLIEGGLREKIGHDEDDAMSREGGEMTWAAWVGHTYGMDIRSLEEPSAHQIRGLIADLDPDAVFAYYVMRQIPQVIRTPEAHRPDLEQYFHNTVVRFNSEVPPAPGQTGEPAMERFGRVFATLYPEKEFTGHFTAEHEDFLLREAVDQASDGPVLSEVQRVARACNARRDAHAAAMINQAISEGVASFTLFGVPHFEKVVDLVPEFHGAPVMTLGAD